MTFLEVQWSGVYGDSSPKYKTNCCVLYPLPQRRKHSTLLGFRKQYFLQLGSLLWLTQSDRRATRFEWDLVVGKMQFGAYVKFQLDNHSVNSWNSGFSCLWKSNLSAIETNAEPLIGHFSLSRPTTYLVASQLFWVPPTMVGSVVHPHRDIWLFWGHYLWCLSQHHYLGA